MSTAAWKLQTPIDAFVFDCDGTLSTIEGIDELAHKNGVSKQVLALTAEAMGKTGINPSMYRERLVLTKPTHEQVLGIGMQYYVKRIPEVEKLIKVLQHLNKAVYIVSAGMATAVRIFGNLLEVPDSHIFAVEIEFDDQGHYLDFDNHSPLVSPEGKRQIVTELQNKHPKLAYIGDGLNDLVVQDLVTRFIGFGGAFYRENIENACQFYIRATSLAPILPLCLTHKEVGHLSPGSQKVYDEGVNIIEKGGVLIKE